MWLSNALSYVGTFYAGAAVLIASLYALSLLIPKASLAARLIGFYLSILTTSALALLATLLLRLVGAAGSAQWAGGRIFKYLALLSMGLTFEVHDPEGILERERPAVLMGNHQSEFDLIMLGCMFPRNCSVTAKSSLRKVPLLGWWMTLARAIFIERANSQGARAAMKGAAQTMVERRQSVYIFPEGTRSYAKEPVLLPFKKGGFHLAVEAGAPIVPCVVANYSHLVWLKSFVLRSGKIPVKGMYTPPIFSLTFVLSP